MSQPAPSDVPAFTLEGICHCGAVSWTLNQMPQHLTACNCSLCRRLGALWVHAEARHITLSYDPAGVHRYVQGDGTLAVISCGTCGCTTHWEPEPRTSPVDPAKRMAVNVRLAEPTLIADFKVRHFDGADSWTFLD